MLQKHFNYNQNYFTNGHVRKKYQASLLIDSFVPEKNYYKVYTSYVLNGTLKRLEELTGEH